MEQPWRAICPPQKLGSPLGGHSGPSPPRPRRTAPRLRASEREHTRAVGFWRYDRRIKCEDEGIRLRGVPSQPGGSSAGAKGAAPPDGHQGERDHRHPQEGCRGGGGVALGATSHVCVCVRVSPSPSIPGSAVTFELPFNSTPPGGATAAPLPTGRGGAGHGEPRGLKALHPPPPAGSEADRERSARPGEEGGCGGCRRAAGPAASADMARAGESPLRRATNRRCAAGLAPAAGRGREGRGVPPLLRAGFANALRNGDTQTGGGGGHHRAPAPGKGRSSATPPPPPTCCSPPGRAALRRRAPSRSPPTPPPVPELRPGPPLRPRLPPLPRGRDLPAGCGSLPAAARASWRRRRRRGGDGGGGGGGRWRARGGGGGAALGPAPPLDRPRPPTPTRR